LNDINALKDCFSIYKNEIACVIIEPIPANNGLLLQDKSFLLGLRKTCTEHKVLLFFDEVISGFRVAFNGAAEYYDITPDIVTYGKIIGGGLPVGAYGAKKEIMASISPEGNVYQAGTLSGNPVAMAAGIAQLQECTKDGFYKDQENRTSFFVNQINAFSKNKNYDFEIVHIGSIFWLNFSGNKTIRKSEEINPDMTKFKQLHALLLDKGIYLGPSGYEVGFVSSAHTKEILEYSARMFCEALEEVFTPISH
jgi:glutamate-1-semialdehyde 2,1-aminomutase